MSFLSMNDLVGLGALGACEAQAAEVKAAEDWRRELVEEHGVMPGTERVLRAEAELAQAHVALSQCRAGTSAPAPTYTQRIAAKPGYYQIAAQSTVTPMPTYTPAPQAAAAPQATAQAAMMAMAAQMAAGAAATPVSAALQQKQPVLGISKLPEWAKPVLYVGGALVLVGIVVAFAKAARG